MPSTPVLGLPYPANTDLVSQGYDAIGDLALAVENELVSIVDEEAWHAVGGSGEPAFATGAANSGAGFQPLEFKKVGNSVRLRGVVDATGDLFTLPVGYRPPAPLLFAVSSQFAGDLYGQVLATGVVSMARVASGSMSFASCLFEFWVD